MGDLAFRVYTSYDGWLIQVVHRDSGEVKDSWYWDHKDYEAGAGGEKIFAHILATLGYSVYEGDLS